MLKLAKYLKPFTISLILAIALLCVQAYGELLLPDYMSRIVNEGIQQGGIENAVPEVIREKELNKILLFLDESEKAEVSASYRLVSYDEAQFSEKYPSLRNENVYVLSSTYDLQRLNSILSKAIAVVSMMGSGSMDNMSVNQSAQAFTLPEGTDPFEALAHMPQEALDTLRQAINEQMSLTNESLIQQSAIQYIKTEYSTIGMDVEHIQTTYILKAGGIMLVFAFVIMLAVIIETFLASKVAAGIGTHLRRDVFRKVTGFSNSEFDRFSTASLITRSTNDIQQVQGLVVMFLRIVVYSPLLAMGGIFKVLNSEASMSWIIVLAVVLILAIVTVMFTFAGPRFKKMQTLIDRVNLVMRESLTGLMVVRAFNAQPREEEKFNQANLDLTANNLFISRLMSGMMPIMMFTMNLISLLIIWVGGTKVDAGSMQVGDMMAFIQYAMQIIMSFLMISMISMFLPRARVSAGRIADVLETESIINDPQNPEEFSASKGIVEFKNVSFKYPNAEDYVLENISFTANPGETTAFIGSTGSGKSTIVHLIPRFYDVTEGSILVDGVDIREVRQKDLRDKIGFVPQKGILFTGTIESNIKFGDERIDEKAIAKAAEIAQAAEFIDAKPDKYSSEIAQGGANVSGGQKQRLSIARAIAKNSKIYIFDDSFSALDFKTDSELRKAIHKNLSNATLLIVAQRIGTIKSADKIIVLEEGKIVGIGKHEELLKTCEVYNQIALSQLSKEELFNE